MTTIKEKLMELLLFILIGVPFFTALMSAFMVLISFVMFHGFWLQEEEHYFKVIYDVICPFLIYYCGKRMNRMYVCEDYKAYFQYMGIGVASGCVLAFKLCREVLDNAITEYYWFFAFIVLSYALVTMFIMMLIAVAGDNVESDQFCINGIDVNTAVFCVLGYITAIVGINVLF